MTCVVGIDPGPTPGVVGLNLTLTIVNADVVQCRDKTLVPVLNGLWDWYGSEMRLYVEQFVIGPRSARSRTPSGGKATRDLINEITRWAGQHAVRVPTLRQASEVKAWATDARLEAARLLELTKGMPHARDAARHALFAAVKDHGLPDPLSKRAGAT